MMTPTIINKTISDFAHWAYSKKYGWLRLICNRAIDLCLTALTLEDTREFINFLIDKKVKKGGEL